MDSRSINGSPDKRQINGQGCYVTAQGACDLHERYKSRIVFAALNATDVAAIKP